MTLKPWTSARAEKSISRSLSKRSARLALIPKYSTFFFSEIMHTAAVPLRYEGRFAIVTNVGAGCDGLSVLQLVVSRADEQHGQDAEVVGSWRPDAGAKLLGVMIPAATVANKPGTPRRLRIRRNTIAQGRPDVSAEPVVLPGAFCCTRTAGAVGTRPSLRPLVSRAAFDAKPGRRERRGTAWPWPPGSRRDRSGASVRISVDQIIWHSIRSMSSCTPWSSTSSP